MATEELLLRLAPDAPPQSQMRPAVYSKPPPVPPVCLRRCLLDPRRDPVTGLALGPASAALSFLLPIYDLELNGPLNMGPLQPALDALTGLASGAFACHVTGSSIERLSVPPYTEREDAAGAGAPPEYRTADVDVMVELKALAVSPRPGAGGHIYMDRARASHRGYTRVVVEPVAAQANPIFCRPVGDDGGPEIYLSVGRVNDTLAERLSGLFPGGTVIRQGPAVNLQRAGTGPVKHGPVAYIDDTDLVPALPLSERPAELTDWLARVRGRSWPPELLQQALERDGRCFLVGAGHASSTRRDLEWRVSFSEPERRLALSLTPQQRKVYVLVKMLQKTYLQEPKVLVTYHIKTLMFWELEQCGDTANWVEEELFERFLSVLDRIETCLERRNIPSYFIPENNLISHALEEDVAAVLQTVRAIRRRPLHHLYGVDEQFRFDFSSPRPLSELHASLYRWLQQGGGAGAEAAEALALSLVEQAGADVLRGIGEQPRCARLLHAAWEALAAAVPEGAPHPVHDDWLLFGAAAAGAMGVDESVFALQALEAAFDDKDRPGKVVQISEEQMETVRHLMPQLGGGMGAEGVDDIVKQTIDKLLSSLKVTMPSPVSLVLSLRKVQLELMRDLDLRAKENIAGLPPFVTEAMKTRIELNSMDLAYKFKINCGLPQEQAVAEIIQKTAAMGQRLSMGGTDRSLADCARSEMTGAVQDVLGPGATPDAAENALQRADGLTELNEQLAKLDEHKPSEANPSRLPFVRDPRLLCVIPMHMVMTYARTFSGSFDDWELDHYYTPYFNMMGLFLKHQLLRYAFRTTGLLTCVGLTQTDWEEQRVVYDVTRAPLYVQQLPAPARALLQLTCGRATLGVLYRFIDLMHCAFITSAERPRGLMTDDSPLQQLDKLQRAIAEAARVHEEDVCLTHLVMRICAQKVLGLRDVEAGLPDVAAVGGDEVAEAVRAILSEWHTDQHPAARSRSWGSDKCPEAPAAEAAAESAVQATGTASDTTVPVTKAAAPVNEAGTDTAVPVTEIAADTTVPVTGAATETATPVTDAAKPVTDVPKPASDASTDAAPDVDTVTEPVISAAESVTPVAGPAIPVTEAATKTTPPVTEADERARQVVTPVTPPVQQPVGEAASSAQRGRKQRRRPRCVVS